MFFESTCNTRAVLPDSLRFIRSDVPAAVTAEELRWLVENNIRTVIDLREEEECRRKPCPLEYAERINYLHMPVTGGNAVPDSPEKVTASYLAMCDENMRKIVRTILDSADNALYFCNAGKDRTGVVTALILMELGYSTEYIVKDYVKSGENLREKLEQYAAADPDVNIEVITPKAEYISEFCKLYKR